MYASTAYLYQQIQTVLLIDISGAYFDRRWQPVYAKNLKLNLGVDNVIFISILAGKLPHEDQQRARTTGIAMAVITRILLLLSHFGSHTFTGSTSAVSTALVFVLLVAFVLAMLIVVATLLFVVATTFAKLAIKLTYRLLLSQFTRQQALSTTEDC